MNKGQRIERLEVDVKFHDGNIAKLNRLCELQQKQIEALTKMVDEVKKTATAGVMFS